MEKDIWKETLKNQENEPKEKMITKYRQKQHNYELEPLQIRNYINTHPIEKINIDTLYQYFGENIYEFYGDDKMPLPHLICGTMNVHPEKKLKTLEAAFQAIDPNIGNLTLHNFNYFQYYCLVLNQLVKKSATPNKFDPAQQIVDLYNLGIQYGLDAQSTDLCKYSNMDYYMAALDLDYIEKSVEKILTKENNIIAGKDCKNRPIYAINFLTARRALHNTEFTYSVREECGKELEKIILFKLVKKYNPLINVIFLVQSQNEKDTNEQKYQKIKNYCCNLTK